MYVRPWSHFPWTSSRRGRRRRTWRPWHRANWSSKRTGGHASFRPSVRRPKGTGGHLHRPSVRWPKRTGGRLHSSNSCCRYKRYPGVIP
jgi:hypothetical protein